MSAPPLLVAAQIIWGFDLPISVDHWEALAALGLDVPVLEARYRP